MGRLQLGSRSRGPTLEQARRRSQARERVPIRTREHGRETIRRLSILWRRCGFRLMTCQTKQVVFGQVVFHLPQLGLILALLKLEFPHLGLEASFLFHKSLVLLLLLVQLQTMSVRIPTCTIPCRIHSTIVPFFSEPRVVRANPPRYRLPIVLYIRSRKSREVSWKFFLGMQIGHLKFRDMAGRSLQTAQRRMIPSFFQLLTAVVYS